VLSYGTRVQRFKFNIDPSTGAISGQDRRDGTLQEHGEALVSIAPGAVLDASNLGNSFTRRHCRQPTGTLLVSDEYGPSLYEFGATAICCA
jgi:hypothetical protein